MMTATELAKKCKNVAENYKTVYMYGCFGQPVSDHIITQKAKQYPSFYTSTKISELKNMIGKGYFGTDCVGLVKMLLWNWCGDISDDNGGAKYISNGVPDASADMMINNCKDVSTDFSDIEVGEFVWMSGHCGVYIGEGLAVEATPRWSNRVQITAVANIGSKSGYNARKWTKHGKLPYISYTNKTASNTPKKSVEAVAKEVLQGKWGNGAERKRKLTAAGYNYSAVQKAINNLLKTDVEYFAKPAYSGASLVEGLRMINSNTSYNYRKKIATANNIDNYTGTAAQNTKMLDLLKGGKLIKP